LPVGSSKSQSRQLFPIEDHPGICHRAGPKNGGWVVNPLSELKAPKHAPHPPQGGDSASRAERESYE
jgi:hypothetical protein